MTWLWEYTVQKVLFSIVSENIALAIFRLITPTLWEFGLAIGS
jgi:hypothetical protein